MNIAWGRNWEWCVAKMYFLATAEHGVLCVQEKYPYSETLDRMQLFLEECSGEVAHIERHIPKYSNFKVCYVIVRIDLGGYSLLQW